jgi:hypothetical protein
MAHWSVAGSDREVRRLSDGAERREHERIPLIADIHYSADSPALTARISDISVGGIFIDTVNALDPGATVSFRLHPPAEISETPIVGEAVVVWRQPMLGMGLRFTRVAQPDWDRIAAYVQRMAGPRETTPQA